MLKIVPFNKELLKDFVYDGVEHKISGPAFGSMAEYYNKLGHSFIGLIEDKAIGVGGIYPLWNGAGGAWLFLNKEARDYKKSVFKILLEYIDMLIKKYEIKTLIVECIDNSIEAHRLIQHLGFTKNKELKMSMYLKRTGA